ncbi:hypothetical protein GCK72_001377 [Caenorhabditis remanei]|uniref:Uncharacterized protein n=1 Tax=Caenorhabditis remanei TaxID=31234 RepID=A0A6A5HMT5_CAERE|nr:hypothetical protein GCK72_001377 [Caenorhabditis remanei]KAF1769560.1 hypothetical protein GCK72_001377 [Caenorhabditis remanei]
MHWSSWAIALNVIVLCIADEAPEGFPEDHVDLVFPGKMKYDSHLRQHDLPPHFIGVNETNLIPLTLRMETRRKRCSCGCSGCDLFPNRSCCSSSCCSSQKPIPLACCPPPPPPKPCCQPAFGPCCPATPNCCPKPCCRGRRPEYEEYEDEEGNPGGVPAPPNPPRTCCPPPTPAAPPPPPPPPPPAPEAPTQCCPSSPYGRTPCRSGCPNGDCGCGRPCCYYQNPTCCNQGQKACCPPEQPCCPELKLDTGCLSMIPPCLRSCPSCPCRKRLMLGKRTKRAAPGLHCQPLGLLGQQSPPTLVSQPTKTIVKSRVKAAGTKTSTVTATKKLIEQSSDHVESPPTAGRLYDFRRAHVRVKRNLGGEGGCQLCLNGTPLKRTKRSFDCVPCTYLQPQYSDWNPFLGDQRPRGSQSPVGTPIAGHRTKRAGCLPHPQCTVHVRRYKRNLIGSQYCEPCNGHYGRKKREAERDQCLRREKRYADEQCDNDEFSVNERSKRQAYNPKGILDIVKLLSKASSGGNNPGGCMKFPACVLAQKKRRKRNADRLDKYYQAVEEHKKQVEEYEKALEEHKRVKRQFFAPDNSAACVPCPAWVTLALASRKKRDVDGKEVDDHEDKKQMTISEAIADIRSKKGYKEGFDADDDDSSEETIETRRKQRRSCQQSDDCLNNVEYAVFQKVYAEKRTKREAVFRRKKCSRCGVSGLTPHRVKRNFGQPNINVSEQNCMAFPQCRHRVKRNFLGEDCNICTQDTGLKRRKRNMGTAQCYPCPGTRA